MAGFFNLAAHILIITGIIWLIRISIQMIATAPSTMEKYIRALSLVTGFLLFIGARETGMDVPTLFFRALNVPTPLNLIVAGIFGPGAIGTLVAWRLVESVKTLRTLDKLIRLNLILTAFFVVVFGDVYAASLKRGQVDGLNRFLLPNVCFVIGLALFVIFKYEVNPPDEKPGGNRGPRSQLDRIFDRI